MLCTYLLCHFDSLFETVVRDMSASSYAVYDEMVKPFQFLEFLFRNLVHISAVGNVTEPVAQYRKFEMLAPDRDDFHPVYLERILIDVMHLPFRCAGILYFCESLRELHPK